MKYDRDVYPTYYRSDILIMLRISGDTKFQVMHMKDSSSVVKLLLF